MKALTSKMTGMALLNLKAKSSKFNIQILLMFYKIFNTFNKIVNLHYRGIEYVFRY